MNDPILQSIRERMSKISEELAKYLAETPVSVITSEQTAKDLFMGRLCLEEREHFEVAFLNSQHELIAIERLFSGTIDGSDVHPRIVVQRALMLNAAAVIFAHNHPSGNPEPSAADRALTKRLQDALKVMDVRALDHIIVSKNRAHSFAACGQM